MQLQNQRRQQLLRACNRSQPLPHFALVPIHVRGGGGSKQQQLLVVQLAVVEVAVGGGGGGLAFAVVEEAVSWGGGEGGGVMQVRRGSCYGPRARAHDNLCAHTTAQGRTPEDVGFSHVFEGSQDCFELHGEVGLGAQHLEHFGAKFVEVVVGEAEKGFRVLFLGVGGGGGGLVGLCGVMRVARQTSHDTRHTSHVTRHRSPEPNVQHSVCGHSASKEHLEAWSLVLQPLVPAQTVTNLRCGNNSKLLQNHLRGKKCMRRTHALRDSTMLLGYLRRMLQKCNG